MPISHPDYPTEVTDNERSQGFDEVITHNPGGNDPFADPQMHAVVRQLSISDRLIKITDMITGGQSSGYRLQRFGAFNFGTPRVGIRPTWLPVGDRICSDPEAAVRLATQELEDHGSEITAYNPNDYPPPAEPNNPFA